MHVVPDDAAGGRLRIYSSGLINSRAGYVYAGNWIANDLCDARPTFTHLGGHEPDWSGVT